WPRPTKEVPTMAAYASSRLELASSEPHPRGNLDGIALGVDTVDASSVLDALIDRLAERVVHRLATVGPQSPNRDVSGQDDSLDSRHAAEYLGIHRDTRRKLAAERASPSVSRSEDASEVIAGTGGAMLDIRDRVRQRWDRVSIRRIGRGGCERW